MRHAISLAAFFTVLSCAGTDARATTILLHSSQPYWAVGVRDEGLSRACSLGQFNPIRSDLYVAEFHGKIGAETLTIAKGSGTNLIDPRHFAKPTEDYFFRNENTTACEVFVGGRRGKGSRPAGA